MLLLLGGVLFLLDAADVLTPKAAWGVTPAPFQRLLPRVGGSERCPAPRLGTRASLPSLNSCHQRLFPRLQLTLAAPQSNNAVCSL